MIGFDLKNNFYSTLEMWRQKTCRECVKDDMEELSLQPEWAVFRDMWREAANDCPYS